MYDPDLIKIDTRHWQVGEIIRILSGKIRFNPERDMLWDDADRSGFIEAIIVGIPIQPFYIDHKTQDEWEVVDGYHRIATILRFHEGKFALTGLKWRPDLEGAKVDGKIPICMFYGRQLDFYIARPGMPDELKKAVFDKVLPVCNHNPFGL